MDNSIEIEKHYAIMREELLRPSVKYQNALKISQDGDEFCVLLGEGLASGVSGFGKTMREAMNNFDVNFDK